MVREECSAGWTGSAEGRRPDWVGLGAADGDGVALAEGLILAEGDGCLGRPGLAGTAGAAAAGPEPGGQSPGGQTRAAGLARGTG